MGSRKRLSFGKAFLAVCMLMLLTGCGKDLPHNDQYNINTIYDSGQDETYVIANGDLLSEKIPGEASICGESIEHDRFLIGVPYSEQPLYLFDRGEMYSICESATHGGLSSEGTTVYYFDPEGNLFLYDVKTKETITVLKGTPGTGEVVLSPNGTHMLYKDNPEANLQLYRGDVHVCNWGDYLVGISVSDDASAIYARNKEHTRLFFCKTDGRVDKDYITIGALSIQEREFCRSGIYKNRDHTELIMADGGRLSFAKNGNMDLLSLMEYDYGEEYLFYRPSTDWVEIPATACAPSQTVGVCDIDTFADSIINCGNKVIAIRRSTNTDPYADKYVAEEADVDDLAACYPDRGIMVYCKGGLLCKQDIKNPENVIGDEPYICNVNYSTRIADGVYSWCVKGKDIYYLNQNGNLYYTNAFGSGGRMVLRNAYDMRGDYNKNSILCKTGNGGQEELYLVSGTKKIKLRAETFPGLVGASEAYSEIFDDDLVYVVDKVSGGKEVYQIRGGKAALLVETGHLPVELAVWTESEKEPEEEAIPEETEQEKEVIASEKKPVLEEVDTETDGPLITVTGRVLVTKYHWLPEEERMRAPDLAAPADSWVQVSAYDKILGKAEIDEDGYYTVKISTERDSIAISVFIEGEARLSYGRDCSGVEKIDLGTEITHPLFWDKGEYGEKSGWFLDRAGELFADGEGDFAIEGDDDLPREKVNTIVVAEGIRSIGLNTFQTCINATSIQLPDSLETIGDGAFWACHALTEVTIPNHVKSLGKKAFGNCDGMQRLILGDSVSYLDEFALAWCDIMTELMWPVSLVDFHEDAFYENKLNRIYYAGSQEQWQSVKKVDALADVEVIFNATQPRELIETPNADDPIALQLGMPEQEREQLQQGTIVTIGKWRHGSANSTIEEKPLEWIVLDEKDGRFLLLSRYAVNLCPYAADWNGDLSWQYVEYDWMRLHFAFDAFTREEREILQFPPDKADSLQDEDKFFLLSAEDYHKYYDIALIRTCPGTIYTDSLVEDALFHHEILSDKGSWWVNAQGATTEPNAPFAYISSDGTVETSMANVKRLVRPAVWVDLDG